MKLVFFDDFRFGVLEGQQIADLSDAVDAASFARPQHLLQALITDWSAARASIEAALARAPRLAADAVRYQPPVPRPGQLCCLAGNYIEPAHPEKEAFNAFLKSPTATVGKDATVRLPAAPAKVFHFEPELALVIGAAAANLGEADDALAHVFGYTQFIDASARGLPGGFFLGKSWHTFAPMGPALVTADEIADPNQLAMKLWVNDQLEHDLSTASMARHVPELLREVTAVLALEPGDVVSTGTHHQALSPIQHGDRLRLLIDGLGPPLTIGVEDPQRRTWER